MKKQIHTFITWVLTALVFGAVGWLLRGILPSDVKAGTARPNVPSVAVGEVASEIFNPPEEFIGHVEPVQEVDILPQIEGYLAEVHFAEGDRVRRGDLLFTIDPEKYAASDASAKAVLAQAKAKVAEGEAAVDRAERHLKRLTAADPRGITQTEKDVAETGLAADRAALASARAAVAQAEAKIAETTFELKHTKVYAPISGRIGKAFMHAGDYVAPSKGALAHIVQTDPVRVTFPVTDRAWLAWGVSAKGAKIGDTRRLRLRLADGSVYGTNGTWAFADNEMSSETATITVRALFANPAGRLVPNAYVTVLADESDPKPVPTVPFLALATVGPKTGLWFVDGDTVHFREVTTGGRHAGRVKIASGATPGGKIVVQGVHKLSEGIAVRIVPASTFE